MAQNSKIEWTDHTVNLWWGCTKVHAGCDNCYAEELSDTRKRGTNNTGLQKLWGEGLPRKKVKSSFSDLGKYQRAAKDAGEYHKVFVGSMMDIFEKPKPLINHKGEKLGINTGDVRDDLFRKISEGEYPNLIFLLLTKRPSNINKYIPPSWKVNPPKNVWFGCSPVDQETYKNFNRHMKKVNGYTFYSIEPQLGPIKLDLLDKVNWIIQGGESGHNKRPFNLNWARIMQADCQFLSKPYFFKQIDKVIPIPDDLLIREFPLQMDLSF